MKLQGKVAVVTGGARGIGQGIALELARQGADVVIGDKSPREAAQATLDGIAAAGRRGVFLQGDVADRAYDERLIGAAVDELGGVDIVVNNAAKSFRASLLEMEPGQAEDLFAVTLWGAYHCTQLGARQMVKQGRGGAIVMISSVHGSRPYPRASAYNGAKAAMIHMAQTWAVELTEHKIRVNAIEPGWIDTPGERAFFTEEQIREQGAKLPMGRVGTPAEIAHAVAFLVSDDASYITGVSLRVDGAYAITH
jgi:glucose 1-dehydrogenase